MKKRMKIIEYIAQPETTFSIVEPSEYIECIETDYEEHLDRQEEAVKLYINQIKENDAIHISDELITKYLCACHVLDDIKDLRELIQKIETRLDVIIKEEIEVE